MSRQFAGALIREQGVTFAVVSVRAGTIGVPSRRDAAVAYASRAFGGVPSVLVEVAGGRVFGRRDLVNFLKSVDVHRIPWRRYRLDGG